MIVLLAFWVFFTITVGLSWRAAAIAERSVISAIVIATLSTLGTNVAFGVTEAMSWVALIDLLLFVYVIYRSLHSKSFWPLWFAGLQGAAILASASGLIFGSANLYYFQTLSGFWAIPALLIMTLGTNLDRSLVRREHAIVEGITKNHK